uniref:Uncharacterized protein n=1 Tax=Pyrodinium bahamense TaxID=73915 RepID=A0A7S0FCC3_9DINO
MARRCGNGSATVPPAPTVRTPLRGADSQELGFTTPPRGSASHVGPANPNSLMAASASARACRSRQGFSARAPTAGLATSGACTPGTIGDTNGLTDSFVAARAVGVTGRPVQPFAGSVLAAPNAAGHANVRHCSRGAATARVTGAEPLASRATPGTIVGPMRGSCGMLPGNATPRGACGCAWQQAEPVAMAAAKAAASRRPSSLPPGTAPATSVRQAPGSASFVGAPAAVPCSAVMPSLPPPGSAQARGPAVSPLRQGSVPMTQGPVPLPPPAPGTPLLPPPALVAPARQLEHTPRAGGTANAANGSLQALGSQARMSMAAQLWRGSVSDQS